MRFTMTLIVDRHAAPPTWGRTYTLRHSTKFSWPATPPTWECSYNRIVVSDVMTPVILGG